MIIVFAVFWLPAIAFCVLLWVEYSDITSFFKKSKQTTGKVVGTIGAQHKRTNSVATNAINATTMGINLLANQHGANTGGGLLLVEYEHENGNIYQVRSKQSFDEDETKVEEVKVNYNPDDASDVAIEGYYANTSYLPRLIGAGLLFAIPLIILMFS